MAIIGAIKSAMGKSYPGVSQGESCPGRRGSLRKQGR